MPRIRKPVATYNVDDDFTVSKPAKKKKTTEKKEEVAGNELSVTDIKRVINAIRRFGNVNTHLDLIVAASNVAHSRKSDVLQLAAELELLCEQAVAANTGGSLEFHDVTINAVDFLRRRDDMVNVVAWVENSPTYRLPFVLPTPKWDMKWEVVFDTRLLLGFRLHGFGQWVDIR